MSRIGRSVSWLSPTSEPTNTTHTQAFASDPPKCSPIAVRPGRRTNRSLSRSTRLSFSRRDREQSAHPRLRAALHRSSDAYAIQIREVKFARINLSRSWHEAHSHSLQYPVPQLSRIQRICRSQDLNDFSRSLTEPFLTL